MDHDDSLYPDALRRLAEYAAETGADLVSPKESKTSDVWWGMPALEHGNVPDAKAAGGIEALLPMVPHKLYRRAFLQEHGIRFPEGRRMLWEDIHLNVAAWRAARARRRARGHPRLPVALERDEQLEVVRAAGRGVLGPPRRAARRHRPHPRRAGVRGRPAQRPAAPVPGPGAGPVQPDARHGVAGPGADGARPRAGDPGGVRARGLGRAPRPVRARPQPAAARRAGRPHGGPRVGGRRRPGEGEHAIAAVARRPAGGRARGGLDRARRRPAAAPAGGRARAA